MFLVSVLLYFNPRLREGGDVNLSHDNFVKSISIHASAKEATLFTLIFIFPQIYFNPRLREGGDYRFSIQIQQLLISIHASAKEATLNSAVLVNWCNFNPRLREGGDIDAIKPDTYMRLFQSTPPRRRRLENLTETIGSNEISIHASAKEATRIDSRSIFPFLISIHASAKEATERQ